MSAEERQDDTIYKVVVNHEEQYSIWPADRESPWAGGTAASRAGKRSVSPITPTVLTNAKTSNKWRLP